jgi:hypothetical protein
MADEVAHLRAVETIISEAGWGISKWETEHHFVSRLRLCPDNRISGEKIIGKGRLPTNNRVTTALKIAARNLRVSDTYLGARFRRLRTKLGASIAIKASSLQIARRHNYYSCDTDRVGQTCRRGVGTYCPVVFRTATWRHFDFSEV